VARGKTAVDLRHDASPLGLVSATPVVEHPVEVGAWIVTLIELAGRSTALGTDAAVELVADASAILVRVAWPDGVATTSRISDSGNADSRSGIPTAPVSGHQEITKE
jgi:hypothetical protein